MTLEKESEPIIIKIEHPKSNKLVEVLHITFINSITREYQTITLTPDHFIIRRSEDNKRELI